MKRDMVAKTDPRPRPLVLYDGACPLCSREIAHYRRRRGSDEIDWMDVADPDNDPGVFGIARAQALARFHVRDRAGVWHTGAAGFACLWSALPAYRWLGRFAGLPGVMRLLEWGYQRFLRWRRRDHCEAGKCRP